MSDTPNTAQELTVLSDAEAACRGFQHDWPRVEANGELPPNLAFVNYSEGRYEIVETCNACGKARSSITKPHSFQIDPEFPRRYLDPVGWHRFKRGQYTRADMRDEALRRLWETKQLAIKRSLRENSAA